MVILLHPLIQGYTQKFVHEVLVKLAEEKKKCG